MHLAQVKQTLDGCLNEMWLHNNTTEYALHYNEMLVVIKQIARTKCIRLVAKSKLNRMLTGFF